MVWCVRECDALRHSARVPALRGTGVGPIRGRRSCGRDFLDGVRAHTEFAHHVHQNDHYALLSSTHGFSTPHSLKSPRPFPFDVLKSRVQTYATGKSYAEVVREVYKEAGVGGFYRGMGITVARAMPSNAIIFSTYVYVRAILDLIEKRFS